MTSQKIFGLGFRSGAITCCVVLFLVSGVLVAQEEEYNERDDRARKSRGQLERETRLKDNFNRYQTSRNMFLESFDKFDVRGIKLGSPIADVRLILEQNFQRVECRERIPGQFSRCSASSSFGNNEVDMSKESIFVDLSQSGNLAIGVFYDQDMPFGEDFRDCAVRAVQAGGKLEGKYGAPFYKRLRSEHVVPSRFSTVSSDEFTIGWGGIGELGNALLGGEWAVDSALLEKGVSISDLKNLDDIALIGDGYLVNFRCFETGRVTLRSALMSSTLGAKNAYQPKPQEPKF